MQSLPVDPYIPEIRRIVSERRTLVVTSPPGSGKTTRIPPALVDAGRVVLLQPRRVAARSLARRIARERGWQIGDEIGWQIRFERRFSQATRLLVMTEGVLTRKLQSDPLISDVATVILDEFHERSIHCDLAISLVKQVLRARDDLRLIVMSATLDTARVAAYLDDAPVLKIDGALYPVDIVHEPGIDIESAVRDSLPRSRGDILCFLPGAGEIRRAAARLSAVGPGIDVHQLHGGLSVEDQEMALEPSSRRKVILATNIAETSLTVEGVDTVIDSGLHRVLRFDPGTALDRLQTERIPIDSAHQRAGRAGRIGPGRAIRLWDRRDEMAEHREAEIARIDLAEVLLDVIAWGDDVRTFDWFEAPDPARVESAIRLLERLGAVDERGITEAGRVLQRLPVHPRLGRIMIAGSDKRAAARICAIVSDGGRWASQELQNLGADIRLLIERFDSAPQGLRRVARELEEIASSVASDDEPIERAILRGFPDRLARRRDSASPKLLLSGGQGAVLAGNGATPDAEFMVALEMRASDRNRQLDTLVTLASPIEKDWLVPTSVSKEHRFDGGGVIAVETRYSDSIPISERRVSVDQGEAEQILANELRARPMSEADVRLNARLEFAGLAVDVDALRAAACVGKTKLPAFRLVDWISPDDRRRLDLLAPDRLSVPSGRAVSIEYRGRGEAIVAVKLQEVFGLVETPRIGPERTPVTFELLAPSGRPVQVTKDLSSFWRTTYEEVRKELRGRYLKHPWPDDPWTAEPTSRAKRRK